MDTPNPPRLGGASQCHLLHCGRQFRPLGPAPGKLRQRVAQGQNGILALEDTCVGVVVRCVMYSGMGQRFSNCPPLCKSQLRGVHCDALDDHLRGPIGHHRAPVL